MQRPSTEQLFQPQPLLEKRLGKDFFEPIPASPGVYRFYDANVDLLYVGKAKNLRRRLFGYKRTRPGQATQKRSRLIGQIRSVVWVETETEQDALLLENRMIRGARPPFNHLNKETETYYYIFLKPEKSELEFRLSMRMKEDSNTPFWFGCFKGHRQVRQAMGSLLRLLWMAEHEVQNPAYLPVQLNRNLTPLRYSLRWRVPESPSVLHSVPDMIRNWLLGKSSGLLDWFWVQIEQGGRMSPFQVCFLEFHLDTLKTFYDKKLLQHRAIRGDQTLIHQDELDDLIVKNRF